LKAADPTIVEAPSSPGQPPKLDVVSITESKISGALEPRAINVKLAIVGFHTDTFFYSTIYPSAFLIEIIYVYAVIFSIDAIKISDTIPIPMKRYIRAKAYPTARSPSGRIYVPGISIELMHIYSLEL
jgi:hypothetical protein